MQAFMPGASPPEVKTAIRFIKSISDTNIKVNSTPLLISAMKIIFLQDE